MHLGSIFLFLSCLSIGITAQRLIYYKTPVLVNRTTSESGVVIGEGNAVAKSPVSNTVVATHTNGLVYSITSGAKYMPKKGMICKSGADFYTVGPFEYLVYAVTDGSASQIIALNVDTLEEAWSTDVQGVVSGTPRVGSDNEHVYFTHNNGDQGMFSVITTSSGGGTLYFYSPPSPAGTGGFAPVGIARNPTPDGNYANGVRNINDFVSWSNIAPGGTIVSGIIPQGSTHAFQLPRVGQTAQVQILTETSWSTNTAPTLSKDGQSMYYSVSAGNRRGAEVRAWPSTSGKNFGAGSSYTNKGDFKRVGGEPPFAGMTLSADEQTAVYASTSNAIYGFMTKNGNSVWKDESLPGVVKTKPVLSPDGFFLYFITSDGTIICKDISSGTTIWSMKNGASPSVLADFTLDAYGTTLCYAEADAGGASTTYYEVAVAELAAPTAAPTQSAAPSRPITDEPTFRVTMEPPTAEPTPSSEEEEEDGIVEISTTSSSAFKAFNLSLFPSAAIFCGIIAFLLY